MIGHISNSIVGYKDNYIKKKTRESFSDYKPEKTIEQAENENGLVQTQNESKDDIPLTDEMRSELISAYRNVNWKSDDSITHLLSLGKSAGKIRAEDIDEALVCFEDANLLNKYSYISEDSDGNSIHNALEHDKAQIKAAIDFYHYVPEHLEKRVASLQRVDDFFDWVSKLK